MALSRRLVLFAVLSCAAVAPGRVSAQHVAAVSWDLVAEVMPEADRFDEPSGDPPVLAAYATGADGTESLIGYVFMTSDVPPEQVGYSGPIEALVGMRLDGTLTGVRVTDYHESYMSQMGDFLRRGGFQEQFSGKYIGDPFRVWGDVDGISRVSISVRALSRGVRDSARRVAAAHATAEADGEAMTPVTDITGMSWYDLRQAGVVERFEVTEPGQGSAGISLAYMSSDQVGEFFLGRIQYESAIRNMTRRGGANHLVLYTIDGSRLRLFVREGWSLVQGGDTTAIEPSDIVALGLPSGGVVSGEATMIGVMLIRRELDLREPFSFIYDLGDLGVHTVEYRTQDARRAETELVAAREAAAIAAEPPAAAPTVDSPTVDSAAAASSPPDSDRTAAAAVPPRPDSAAVAAGDTPRGASGAIPAPGSTADREVANGADSGTVIPAPAGAPTAGATDADDPLQDFDFAVSEDETMLERAFADAQWSRVATMLAVLALAMWAFFSKSTKLRWVSLTATLLVLGWGDGGFLSVSHITSGIWAGPGVYLRDLPLLLIVSFTIVTTLVWGRVFCGFLCPFGALQDFIERVVPQGWQRPLPQRVHDRAIYLKYGILALIVLPAIAGSHQSLYQYFEPFGTVFFLSPSPLFWAIAGGILLASTFVPRFYCRYACPLGAALAIGSVVSLRRIPRVEQCQLCKVCEQKCPTGAIRGPEIDFKECVRCNTCEIQLIEKRGVCKHDMEVVRPRLVQLEARRAVGVVDG